MELNGTVLERLRSKVFVAVLLKIIHAFDVSIRAFVKRRSRPRAHCYSQKFACLTPVVAVKLNHIDTRSNETDLLYEQNKYKKHIIKSELTDEAISISIQHLTLNGCPHISSYENNSRDHITSLSTRQL